MITQKQRRHNSKKRFRCILILSIILTLTVGCQSSPTATAEPPTSTKPPPTETRVPTSTPEPTATPEPSSTPTNTPEPPTSTPTPGPVLPDKITVKHPNLYPEGIEYDKQHQRFLLSSITQGTIHQVTEDGTFSPFIEDDELQLTAGLEIDHENNRLLVANTSHAEDQAFLGAYDLATGQRLFMANLSDLLPAGKHMANDVAIDANGVAYVTDFYASAIYSVDTEGNSSVFVEDKRFSFLNGIVAHPDGYLIVGSVPNLLFKIPLDTAKAKPIKLDDNIVFQVADGMLLHPDGGLIMVTFPDSIVQWLASTDDWSSVQTMARSSSRHKSGWGTTITMKDEWVYVIHSHLNLLMDKLDRNSFEIVPVVFEKD